MSNWSLCLLCEVLFVFSKRKCISKSSRTLMNYKPENRIPWLFKKFSNDLKNFHFFPDFSVTAATVMIKMDELALSVNPLHVYEYSTAFVSRAENYWITGCQLSRWAFNVIYDVNRLTHWFLVDLGRNCRFSGHLWSPSFSVDSTSRLSRSWSQSFLSFSSRICTSRSK